MKNKSHFLTLLLALLLVLASCGAEQVQPPPAPASEIEETEPEPETEATLPVLPEVVELEPGEVYSLPLPPEAAVDCSVRHIVKVKGGELTALQTGETTLTVTLGTQEKTIEVRVLTFEDQVPEGSADLPSGKYLLVVNNRHNYVVVYDLKDEAREHPLKAMICSTGRATPSKEGKTYRMGGHKAWSHLYGNVWGQYSTGIVGDILFHSVPYKRKDKATLIGSYYNRLGTAASMGCVRLRVCDAKWICECCESGTLVTFTREDVPCPLAYDLPLTLPDALCWDPTDPDEGNPWLAAAPSITAENHAVGKGSSFDPADYFEAYDSVGDDAKAITEVSGVVDTARPGRYLLHFFLRDALGKTASRTVCITVV